MKNQAMQKFIVGTITVGILLVGLFIFWPDSPTSAFVGQFAQYDLFTDHHHQPPKPTLSINYTTGKKGSYFLISAANYPVFNTIIITINDELIGTMPLDDKGSAVFQLQTNNADNGVYFVTITAAVDAPTDNTQIVIEPTAQTAFTISPQAPLRASTSGTEQFNVPEGIASYYYLYLPTLNKYK